MKKWLPHAGIVVGVCVALYALFFHRGEEERIRQQLAALEDAVEVAPGGGNLVLRAARVRKSFNKIFVKDVVVEIPNVSAPTSGRHALAKLASGAPRLFEWGKLDLSDLTIALDASKTQATAFGPAQVTAQHRNGKRYDEQRTASLRFDKIDGAWLVVSLTVSPPDE